MYTDLKHLLQMDVYIYIYIACCATVIDTADQCGQFACVQACTVYTKKALYCSSKALLPLLPSQYYSTTVLSVCTVVFCNHQSNLAVLL